MGGPRWSSGSWLPAIVVTVYACLHPADAYTLGRATYYGAGDGFTLNDGSCACHKQDVKSGWLSSRCKSGFCFDYIGEKSKPCIASQVSMQSVHAACIRSVCSVAMAVHVCAVGVKMRNVSSFERHCTYTSETKACLGAQNSLQYVSAARLRSV